MKKWDWIFFDADETLFTFDSFTGLQRMFLDYSITFTAEDFQDYQAVNKPLWVDYQNGAITSLQLQHARFQSWAERLKVEPGQLNDAFINAMAETCSPLPVSTSSTGTRGSFGEPSGAGLPSSVSSHASARSRSACR